MRIDNVNASVKSSLPQAPLPADVQELLALQTAWNKAPTTANTQALKIFMESHETEFEELYSKNKPPAGFPPETSFADMYNTALTSLSRWAEYGHCPKWMTSTNEWITNVIEWAG